MKVELCIWDHISQPIYIQTLLQLLTIFFCNKHHYLNYVIEPGEISTSDHILIIFRLSTKSFINETPLTYKINKANWESFKETLNKNITLKDLNNCNLEQLENSTKEWMETRKHAMDRAIPKSSYKFTYQLKITPEIRQLESQYKLLRNNARINGWSYEHYREYTRIRHELREVCKEIITEIGRAKSQT